MIDAEGFRPNVGIILTNDAGQVLWARRHGHDAWQFPQGGIHTGETPEQAMYRELWEEIGLEKHHVKILAQTRGWLRYRLPIRYVRYENPPPVCIGQKQKWFLLGLASTDDDINWYPLNQVVSFKREVYRKALQELAPRSPTLHDTY